MIRKLLRITENFQISLGITSYWFTYIHSFKLESNDKNTWFFATFCQYFFKIFSIYLFRGINFSKFFSAEGDKNLEQILLRHAFCRPCALFRGPLFYKKCSIDTFDTGFRFSRSLRKKPLFFFFRFPKPRTFTVQPSPFTHFLLNSLISLIFSLLLAVAYFSESRTIIFFFKNPTKI